MNKRLLPVFGFALIVSAIATTVIYRILSSKMTATAPVSQTKVFVATRDLSVGTLLTSADLRQADWFGPVPKGVPANAEQVINRGVVTAIYESEPIVESRLAPAGAGGGLAATIPVGMRAVAVRVNEVVGVAGFVVPGMRVDVIVSGTPPSSNSNLGTLTRTVLQNIAVLSAGQKIDKNGEGKPETASVVNLLVTPEQAETLSLAGSQTNIQLVLRNPLDTKEAQTPGTATAKLFAGGQFQLPATPKAAVTRTPKPVSVPVAAVQPAKVEAPAPPPPFIVEVLHGSKKMQMKFPAEEATRSRE